MDPGCSGEPAFDDRLGDQPPDQWAELVRQRRRWFWGEGYPLVRMLQRFLLEAPELAESLGYSDTDCLFREGYGLDLVIGAEGVRSLESLLGAGSPSRPRQRQSARACACCGQSFLAGRRDARYCCNRCRARASRERRRP
ncbi:hypothetical protein [Synechococcus sp. RedBA-s]|uniref:hypothetical protein n=1 Tax=Synechococcus sp. RedBA-s TaxID=2823741 RepID=UPI0020CD3B8F|nr:hypothetical protein [Synechococcus sp. RedBA-s]MCP9801516.1 hypothetical protein [Synechococcus sp. RedBA-s]